MRGLFSPGYLLVAGLVVVSIAAFNLYGINDMSHQSIQIWLRLYGESIYEYRTITGNWPTRTEDLGRTSLAVKSPYWKSLVDDEIDVIVWPADMKPDPKDNADVVLVYHNKGLFAEMGHTWVCFGDLHAEYLPTDELHARLKAQKK